MNVEEKIIQTVEENRQEIIDFVQKCVQIPSLTGEEKELGDYILKRMIAWGLDDIELVEKEPGHPNILARVNGKKEGPTIVFNGHLDVVPVGDESLWTDPPFSGVIKDGKMYGRGTSDMKAGTCTSILSAVMLKRSGVPLDGNVLLTVVCDEEVCGERGVIHLLDEKRIQGDMGINCEPTNIRQVNICHKGILKVQIKVYGKTAHGSRPYLGINAIEKTVPLLVKIQELEEKLKERSHPILPPPTILMAMIESGYAMNIVPDVCTVSLCWRMLPTESKEQCLKELQDILDDLAQKDTDFKAEMEVWQGYRPPLDVPEEAPIIGYIQKAHQYVTGEEIPIGFAGGGVDACFIVKETGMPMPVYGPGNAEVIARPDEYVHVEDLITAVKVYAIATYYAMQGK